jgi:hypothetical protein
LVSSTTSRIAGMRTNSDESAESDMTQNYVRYFGLSNYLDN